MSLSFNSPDPTLSALLAADVFVVSLLIVVPIVILLLRQIAAERQRAEALLLNVLPAPIAIPTSAVTRAGASLTPSPIMATRLPCRCTSCTVAAF